MNIQDQNTRPVRFQMYWIYILIPLIFINFGYAQETDPFGDLESDSLLFGDEFDLGGDDFSFDFEDSAESDTSAAESDDEFGIFDTEEDAEAGADLLEESGETETAEEDDWGLGDEDLFGEDSTAADSLVSAFTDHPLDFRKNFEGSILEGTGVTFSVYSPQMVNDKLTTWYSYIDFSLTAQLPWHLQFDPVELSFLVDISSFSFENSFPAGGAFRGASFMPYARAEIMGLEAELGMGMYYPTFGLMTGLGYSYQYYSLFTSLGYRWNWAYNIEPIGSAWWMEPRFTLGIKLW